MATEQTTPEASEAFWLFGYGSLIWKPPPHYDQRLPGYITHYVRRFWQESHDHRGTPTHPGRVVTLLTRTHWSTLPDEHGAPERVWGVAYHIPADKAGEVREYLDIREINGYSIDFIDFYPSSGAAGEVEGAAEGEVVVAAGSGEGDGGRTTIKALLYIGTPTNPQFTGPQPLPFLASRIAECVGPSGRNAEYLFNLEEALRALGQGRDKDGEEWGWEVDEHVVDLAGRVRVVLGIGEGVGVREVVGQGTGTGEHDEEEEVER